MAHTFTRRTLLATLPALFVTPACATSNDLSDIELALVREVNVMRKARGLKLLALQAQLNQAARAYAERLAARTFFDHVSPDGDGPTDRAEAAGYDWRRLGETLAAGQTSAKEAAISWRDSPGHAKIIFDPKHKHVGVGFVLRKSKDPKKPELEHFWVLLAGDML
jgi:uncharacterized protein YkwD